MIDYREHNGRTIAVVSGRSISSAADALDLMAEVYYGGCGCIVLPRELLPESFFSLKTGVAGEMLQKFSNYGMKLAIVGGFGTAASRSLAAFIYECNKGRQVFFKKTTEEALDALSQA